MITEILQQLEGSALGIAISEGELLFPWLEAFHVVAVVVVFGSILTVDLRLLGGASYRQSAARMLRELLPWTWAAFGLAVVTGGAMFLSKATTYAANGYFQLKMVALLGAGINMALFHLGAYRTIGHWDGQAVLPARVRLAGAVSLALWLAVLCFGRWIGFTLSHF